MRRWLDNILERVRPHAVDDRAANDYGDSGTSFAVDSSPAKTSNTDDDPFEEYHYIAQKIRDAKFISQPFPHLLIENFLSDEHFEMLIKDRQVNLPEMASTAEVIDTLQDVGYVIQKFPGCITDKDEYLRCLEQNDWAVNRNKVGSVGLAFRLQRYSNPKVQRLVEYMNSPLFKSAMEDKFNIKQPTKILTAIQKYLTGYEISPHPDTRQKCLTYLVNINTSNDAQSMELHTHLLRFTPEREYIYDTWNRNPSVDRCWVPWSWCESVKRVAANNSLLMFEAHDRSLHAVKLNYDHKKFQRTQLYGNLFYQKTFELKPLDIGWLESQRPNRSENTSRTQA